MTVDTVKLSYKCNKLMLVQKEENRCYYKQRCKVSQSGNSLIGDMRATFSYFLKQKRTKKFYNLYKVNCDLFYSI